MCSRSHVDPFKFFISPGDGLQVLFLSEDPDTIHLITYCLYAGKDLRSAVRESQFSSCNQQRRAEAREKRQEKQSSRSQAMMMMIPFHGR